MAGMVPAATRLQSPDSAKIAMPADPPQDHLDEHALVNLNQQLFDYSAAGVCFQK
jgi:hypothetical protein